MRILEGRAAEKYVWKLEQRGQKLDALEPSVRHIVEDVRRGGDRSAPHGCPRIPQKSHETV